MGDQVDPDSRADRRPCVPAETADQRRHVHRGLDRECQQQRQRVVHRQPTRGRSGMATATITVPRPTATSRAPRVPAMLAGFGLATAVALVAALRLPAETTVLGLAAFGILHNVLELRYVAGRFDRILTGPFVALLVALITGIMLCRLVPAAGWSRPAEILLAYGLLGVACAHGMRRRPAWLAAAAVVLVAAAATSLSYPAYHFVLLAHLHNVVPLLFLWEWARDLPRGRVAFRAAQIGWVLVVPALLLAGAFDGWMAGGAG